MNEVGRAALDSTTFNLRNGSLSLTLRFSSRALAALRSDIATGFLSAPRRGSESGGILVGDMAQQGSQWAVMIDIVTPVPIEYQYGLTYRLSSTDKQRFRELASAGDFGSRPIGWYRANTRSDKDIDEADRQISQTFFAVNQSVFLMCEPSPGGNIHANCIVMLPRRTEVMFPFELGEFSALDSLAAGHPPELPELAKAASAAPAFTAASFPAAKPEPRYTPAAAPRPAPPPARPAPPSDPLITPRNLKIAAAIAAGAAILWYARGHVSGAPMVPAASAEAAAPLVRSAAPAAVDAPSLGLRAEYQGNSLLLGWDRNSPDVAAAVSGAVTIADGSRTRIIRLTSRDLRTGSILYKPSADDINVEFAIGTPSGASESQSIRIIGAAPPPARAAAGPNPPASAPPRLAPQVIPQPSPAQPARTVARFQPPPETAVPGRRSVATLDAPVLSQAELETGTILLPSTVVLPPGPAAVPNPSGSRSAQESLQKAARLPAISTPPASAPAENSGDSAITPPGFQRAIAIRSPAPSFPTNASLPPNIFDRPFEVNVDIHIDSKGRVTSARLAPDNRPVAAAFGPSAISAARSWIFRPATLRGLPIESTMVLSFRYSAPASR